MRAFVHGSKREVLLVVLLLGIASAADWTDDLFSYNNAVRYRTFEIANGASQGPQGGTAMNYSAVFSALMRPSSGQRSKSTLESVYSDPYAPATEAQPSSAASRSANFGRSASRDGFNATGLSGNSALGSFGISGISAQASPAF